MVRKGAAEITGTFLSYSFFRTSLDQPVGIYHAIMGTLLITLFAALISVPVGIFRCDLPRGVRQGEQVGPGSHVPRRCDDRHSVDRGSLFAFAMFTLLFGASYRSGLGGSVALSLLMIPIVVRSTEEMLPLVPNDLREAAYALGTPKWRTIMKVVVPTALGGIITGVTLATARVIGETAPLLLIAGLTARTNFDIFNTQMTTLPVLVYSQKSRGTPEDLAIAWGAALVLVLIVLVLNLLARFVGKIFAPKTGR
ncbi:MAG: ABC transporter permease subunit [Marmoricola sp.]